MYFLIINNDGGRDDGLIHQIQLARKMPSSTSWDRVTEVLFQMLNRDYYGRPKYTLRAGQAITTKAIVEKGSLIKCRKKLISVIFENDLRHMEVI